MVGGVPYRAKVTNFLKSDENFARRIISHDKVSTAKVLSIKRRIVLFQTLPDQIFRRRKFSSLRQVFVNFVRRMFVREGMTSWMASFGRFFLSLLSNHFKLLRIVFTER